jgi:hypothetical protein
LIPADLDGDAESVNRVPAARGFDWYARGVEMGAAHEIVPAEPVILPADQVGAAGIRTPAAPEAGPESVPRSPLPWGRPAGVAAAGRP